MWISSSHFKLTFISVNRALCSISILSLSSTTDKGLPAHQQLHLMLEISFMHTQTWLYDQATFTPVSPSNHHQVSKFSVRRTNKKLQLLGLLSTDISRGEKAAECHAHTCEAAGQVMSCLTSGVAVCVGMQVLAQAAINNGWMLFTHGTAQGISPGPPLMSFCLI